MSQSAHPQPSPSWEERYAAVDRLWSGEPNEHLTGLAAHWEAGRSLDIGCGEGDDVLWLASRGWRATGVDLSTTAVERLLAGAAERGLSGLVSAVALDAGRQPLPVGPFDLVTSFFVHGGPQEDSIVLAQVLADGAARLVDGGRLLTAVHCVNPPWHRHRVRTYRPEELVEEVLARVADRAAWSVETCEERWRDATGPDGEAGRRSDAVVCLRRIGS